MKWRLENTLSSPTSLGSLHSPNGPANVSSKWVAGSARTP